MFCQLADVPVETVQEAEEYNKLEPNPHDPNKDEAGYQWWLNQPTNVAKYNHFKLFGWGRVTREASDLIESYGHDPVVGEETDPAKAKAIIEAQLYFRIPEWAATNIPAVCWG
jgi:hypothetical protein